MSPDEEEEQPLSKMATTIDNSNAVQATKKKHLGIPEAVFVVRKLWHFILFHVPTTGPVCWKCTFMAVAGLWARHADYELVS